MTSPYDEDIAAIDPEDSFRERIRQDLLCKAEGYQKAQEDYQPLVEACRRALPHIERDSTYHEISTALINLEAK